MADRPHRTRSRSPRGEQSRSSRHHSHRERSPHRHHHRSKRERTPPTEPVLLPYNSRHISKRDLKAFEPMFALYLDIQKGKVLEDMDDTEVKGRWKSFVGKWNRRELAEGWYDPTTLQKAVASAAEEREYETRESEREPTRPQRSERESRRPPPPQDEESDSDDSIGPALPGQGSRQRARVGPKIPNTEDLELKREMEAEDGLTRRDDIRYSRKQDRKEQKEALDELVPRAEAGTRERQLEKKAMVNETMRAFRDKSPGGEVPEQELMGGGDGISEYKKQKEQFERKKNERELRKEEILRARQAEREERLMSYREKEEGTMAMLKALAKQNFGA